MVNLDVLPHRVQVLSNVGSANVEAQVQEVKVRVDVCLVHVLRHHVTRVPWSRHLSQWQQPSRLLLLNPKYIKLNVS